MGRRNGTCHFTPEEKHAGVVCDDPDDGCEDEDEQHMTGLNVRSEIL
jgi:hypothetical protein